LLIAGMVMAARMIGSSFATTAAEVVALKMLHALEVPFLLVGHLNTSPASIRLSATLPGGFQFAKQVAAIFSPRLPAICMTGLASRTPMILGGMRWW
jgi:OHS family lactose permease-like MFS transporter